MNSTASATTADHDDDDALTLPPPLPSLPPAVASSSPTDPVDSGAAEAINHALADITADAAEVTAANVDDQAAASHKLTQTRDARSGPSSEEDSELSNETATAVATSTITPTPPLQPVSVSPTNPSVPGIQGPTFIVATPVATIAAAPEIPVSQPTP
ncbi:hypothetical protein HK405_002534, partial [Cladochytrium tenue]